LAHDLHSKFVLYNLEFFILNSAFHSDLFLNETL